MYIVIVNPEAGQGKSKRLFGKIKEDPLYQEANCRTFLTQGPGHAERIAEQVAEIYHESLASIIVIGGDGTLHEVMNGMKASLDIPICFIPAGSGNDFARGIGLRSKGLKLFKKIVRRPKRFRVHLGAYVLHQRYKYGARIFANSIGFGLDGIIVALVNSHKERQWVRRFHLTPFLYPIAFIRALKRVEPINFELEIDGYKHPINEAMMVTITNHPYYGGGMKISPKASLHHNKVRVLIIEPLSRKKLMTLFLMVFTGKHTHLRQVHEIEANKVTIRSKEMIPYQVDGQSGRCCECEVKKASPKTTIYVD